MRRQETDNNIENFQKPDEKIDQHDKQIWRTDGKETFMLNNDSEFQEYLNKGVILKGKYRINGVIGNGGFGITYDGTDLNLDMHVAIKEYFPRSIASRNSTYSKNVTCMSDTALLYEQGLKNFLEEARNMAKFAGQENFVYVFDFFSENNTAYIIMEFVPGQNLKQFLEEGKRLSITEVKTIVLPVMNALEMIHSKHLIHRDISPSNIMLISDGKVKLLDFGAVREVSLETQYMSTMSSVYKHGYSPIEQLTRDMRQGTYSDIYALSATIYRMLTGIVPPSPFARLSGSDTLLPPSKIGVDIEPLQEETLMEGLAIYGQDRIQTVGELKKGLFGISDVPVPERESVRRYPGKPVLQRPVLKMKPFIIGGLVGLFIIALLVFGVTAYRILFRAPEMEGSQDQKDNNASADSVEEENNRIPYKYPEGTVEYNGHHYYIYNDSTSSWENAAERCVVRGGYMAVINDSKENDFLYKYMLSMGFDVAFFGLVRDQIGNWRYLGGDISNYRNWGVNSKGIKQPNDQDGPSKYAAMSIYMKNGYWSDVEYGKRIYTPDGVPYKNRYTYICEWNQ